MSCIELKQPSYFWVNKNMYSEIEQRLKEEMSWFVNRSKIKEILEWCNFLDTRLDDLAELDENDFNKEILEVISNINNMPKKERIL